MARKLIDQEEAARLLGVTPDEVSSLRDRKKLFPYRDGDQWKYKQEDVERYREELQAEREASGGGEEESWKGDSDLGGVELQLNDDLDSILLSEIELGKSAGEGASTIIGKMGDIPAPDSDLTPAGETPNKTTAKPQAAAGDSDISLAAETGSKGGSTITLAGEPVGDGSSGFSLAGTGDSAVTMGDLPGKGGSGFALSSDLGLNDSGIKLAGDSGLSLASDVKLVPGASELAKKPGGSSDKLFGSDALKLSDDELSLIDAPTPTVDKGKADAKKSAGSSIKLGDEELEVVLGVGSDVTQSPTDSGIQLISASDSGLSLDQPLALGGSARRLLDMDDEPNLEDSGAEITVDQKSDDDFLLTTSDAAGLEESSDSGSQVIALDTDDELSSGMFAPVGGGAGLLEEEPATVPSAPMGATMLAPPGMQVQPGMMAAVVPTEASYSGANVAVLAVCVVLLLFCGMLTFDLMRNMWSWDAPYSVNSSIMDSIGNTVGWMEK